MWTARIQDVVSANGLPDAVVVYTNENGEEIIETYGGANNGFDPQVFIPERQAELEAQ